MALADDNRIESLTEIIRSQRVASQHDLAQALARKGIETTQSSISRDLKKLGVVKVEGAYKLPEIAPGESTVVDRLEATACGANLIVLKTGPGNANRAAVMIDGAGIPGLVGTIAGDDTIFLAVSGKKEQPRILKRIFSLLNK